MKWAIILLISAAALFGQAETFYSVQTHFGQFYRADMDSADMVRMLDSVKASGIKFIRDECYWSEVEKIRGVYEYPKQVDDFVKAAAEREIGIVMILNYNNALYAPHSGSGVTTDSNRTAYAKYCVETVKRYAPMGVKYYEIWNEPNIPLFWDPAPDAEDYFKLLQVVYPQVKTINTPTVILSCATSPAEGNPAPFISGIDFIKNVYDLGGGNYMDGVSFHLYTVDKPVESWYSSNISAIKNIVNDKPLYLTEVGYPTSSVWPNVSQQSQALYLSRLYLLGRKDLQMINWYDLKNDGENAAENEHNFGIMNYNLSPKPALTAYKSVVEQTSGKELDSISVLDNNYHYVFRSSTEETHAIWNPAQNSKIIASFPQGALKVKYTLGSTEYIYDKDGIVTMRSIPEPAFITGIDALPEIDHLEFTSGEDSVIEDQRVKYEIKGFTTAGEQISIDYTAVEWSFSNNLAYFDSLGYLTASAPGRGFVQAKFLDKEVTKEIEILPFINMMGLDSFNSPAGYNITFLEMLPATSVSVTDTNASEGGSACLIDYSFKYKSKTAHRIVFEKDIKLIGEPDSVLIDIYNNGNGHVINFQVQDADNENFSMSTKSDFLTGKNGWQTLSIPLNSFGEKFNFPAQLKKITVYTIQQNAKTDSIYSGKILLDNLRAHYSPLTFVGENKYIVNDCVLYQNYPNPFNPGTTIAYKIAKQSTVEIRVINILGENVYQVSSNEAAGYHELDVDMSRYSAGVYFCVLEAKDAGNGEVFREVKKMVLLK